MDKMEGILDLKHCKGYTIIDLLQDEFEPHTLPKASRYLKEILHEKNYPNIIFDLSKVTFIDSSVIGLIIDTWKKNVNFNCEIIVVCDREDVISTMKMLKLPEILKIFPDREGAIQYIEEEIS